MLPMNAFLVAAAALLFFVDSVTCLPSPHPVPNRALDSLQVPLNGLPAPTNLKLKYVALGLGTQNYTCPNITTTPVATGAVATLYDTTSLLLNTPSRITSLTASAYHSFSSLGLPELGRHWFSADHVPTFELENASPPAFLSATKIAAVHAPSSSLQNSVDWLYLADDGRDVSKHLKAVYRVETVGGSPPTTCDSVGDITVDYAAEYWLYD